MLRVETKYDRILTKYLDFSIGIAWNKLRAVPYSELLTGQTLAQHI
jgi:hypothetical protein